MSKAEVMMSQSIETCCSIIYIINSIKILSCNIMLCLRTCMFPSQLINYVLAGYSIRAENTKPSLTSDITSPTAVRPMCVRDWYFPALVGQPIN